MAIWALFANAGQTASILKRPAAQPLCLIGETTMITTRWTAAAVIASVAMVSPATAATEIVLNVFTGPQHFVNDPFKAWAKDVQDVTKGRVTVKFLPTNAAPPPRQMDGVISGQFDAAFIFNGFTAKRALGPQFGILPFVQLGSAENSSVAYWRTYQRFFGPKNEFGKFRIRVLSMFLFPGGNFHSNDATPIHSIEEMKKRKMWALAGTPSRVLKVAGVNHVSGPAARINEFTQTNVVDGLASLSFDAVRAFGAMSFVKTSTYTEGKLQTATFLFFISEKKWAQISAEDQKAILSVSGEKLARAVGKRADRAEMESRQAMEKSGIKVMKAKPEFAAELKKAGQFLVDDWIKAVKTRGVDGKAVLDAYEAEQKKLAAGK